MVAMTRMGDLLGPEPVRLPGDAEAEAELLAGEKAAIVAAAHPSASVAWAALAEQALDDDAALARAADTIGETDEYQRCVDLLDDCDPAARAELGLG